MSKLQQLSALLAKTTKRYQLKRGYRIQSGVSDNTPFFDSTQQGNATAQRPTYCVVTEFFDGV